MAASAAALSSLTAAAATNINWMKAVSASCAIAIAMTIQIYQALTASVVHATSIHSGGKNNFPRQFNEDKRSAVAEVRSMANSMCKMKKRQKMYGGGRRILRSKSKRIFFSDKICQYLGDKRSFTKIGSFQNILGIFTSFDCYLWECIFKYRFRGSVRIHISTFLFLNSNFYWKKPYRAQCSQ